MQGGFQFSSIFFKGYYRAVEIELLTRILQDILTFGTKFLAFPAEISWMIFESRIVLTECKSSFRSLIANLLTLGLILFQTRIKI